VFALLGVVAHRPPSCPLTHSVEKREALVQLVPDVLFDLEQLDGWFEPGPVAERPEISTDGAEAIRWDLLACLGSFAGHVGGDRRRSHASGHAVVFGVEDGAHVDTPPDSNRGDDPYDRELDHYEVVGAARGDRIAR